MKTKPYVTTSPHIRTYFTNASLVNKSDPYKTLGLEWGASLSEIKSSYRLMAMKYHPDVGREKSEVKFAEVQRAYEALTAKVRGREGHITHHFN